MAQFTSGLDLQERQIALLRRVCAACETGFRYRELDDVVSLLDLVCDRVTSGVRSFERPLVELITVCGRPIVREKANEELLSAGLTGFEAMLGALGKILHMPFPAGQVQAALALQEIAQGKDTLRSNDPGMVFVLGAGEVKQDLRPTVHAQLRSLTWGARPQARPLLPLPQESHFEQGDAPLPLVLRGQRRNVESGRPCRLHEARQPRILRGGIAHAVLVREHRAARAARGGRGGQERRERRAERRVRAVRVSDVAPEYLAACAGLVPFVRMLMRMPVLMRMRVPVRIRVLMRMRMPVRMRMHGVRGVCGRGGSVCWAGGVCWRPPFLHGPWPWRASARWRRR